MKESTKCYPLYQRLLSFAMAALMVFGIIPLDTRAATTAQEYTVEHISTEADDQTLGRPGSVYGENTLNAGKVTVGKSVHNGAVSIAYGDNKTQTFTPAENNFIITSSQAAQVVGLASESAVPVDVVFVLDTSNSMNNGRATSMVTAANNAIRSLLAANPNNRIGVVAFSGASGSLGAANQLSALAHYDDVDSNNDGDLNDNGDITAASNHLRWGNSSGTVVNNGAYIIGRGTDAGVRQGVNGGTNIHAGVALGAKMLTNAASTTVQVNGKNITRMPFLVVLSDGAPTYSSSSETWHNPSMSSQQGPGGSYYSGNGFLTALTAAYYKGKITEHYYGANASENNRCYIYTIGVGLESLTGDAKALAQITMDPDTFTKGNYATANAASWWNYGRTHDDNQKDTAHGWKAYWDNFLKTPASDFSVEIDNGQWQNVWIGEGPEGSGRPNYQDYTNGWGYVDWGAYNDAVDEWEEANYERVWVPTTFTITDDTISETKNYVNGKNADGSQMFNGGIAYNDDYFTAEETSEIEAAFNKAMQEIQLKAMSSPTHVETGYGADFSGYVTYTDPIGEYMEVKKIHGVLINGNLFEGKSFAQYISNWDNAPAEFKTSMVKILKERCNVTGATMSDDAAAAFLSAAAASANQANYNASTGEFDNSIVWWGKSYKAQGEEDIQIQWLDFADNDTVEYIESAQRPEGADYVCRSYYFYGTAGGTVTASGDYLHFVVRVQRSLVAPYQETIVISAPASMLSAEKVLITEKTNAQGTTTYTATITEADPARVVYEVGLRSDINAFNVEQMLADNTAYLGETTVNGGQTVYTNYDAAKGEYYFYTNDWNRGESESSHHRAMTHATFDAASDNSFYTYTEDTPIYTKSGDTYTLYNGTAKPSGTYYYAREVYDWSASTATGNTHTAVKRTEYILVDIPADSDAVKKGTDSWYVAKGAYKASSLSTAVEDVAKDPNRTGTATIVVHPHRTEDSNNSHYTVLLGNNGKLTLKAADTKTVDIARPGETSAIADADGRVVMVGDELTYTIKVINGETTTADAVVTDKVPVGTEFVSSDNGVYDAATGTVTWNINDLPAGQYVEVSFVVRVTEAALTGELDVVTIDNQAYVKLENGFAYTTNITKNPPEGKKVVNTDGTTITGSVAIPDVLVYRIRWHNDSGRTADVTVTDIIPAGTSYVANSASHNGVYDAAAKTITWTLEDVEASASGVVSFRVNVNATAGETIENGAKIKIGDNEPRVTNKTSVTVDKGDLVLSKNVVTNGFDAAANQTFTLRITEAGLGMNGTFAMLKNGASVDGGITFTNGTATVAIKHGDKIEIQGITAGAIFSVIEDAKSGFTPAYAPAAGSVTIVKNADAGVAVTNTYKPNAVQIQLKANKVLSTSFDVDPTTFGFLAQSCDANGVVDGAKQPLSGEVTVSSQSKTAEITFGAETFSAEGTYYYLISEINGGVAGVTYAADRYIVQVDVTDDGTGQLKAAEPKLIKKYNGTAFVAVGNSDTLTFTNTYAPKETALVLKGEKIFHGRDLKHGEFSFVVKDGNNNDITYGINDQEGNIIFQAIPYTTAGNHEYIITEVNSGLKGVNYSTASFTVTVKVEDKDGQLVATPTYPNGGVVFENTYTPDDVSLTLTGTKELTGRAMTAGEFSFSVTEVIDGKAVEVTTGRNDGSGNIVFAAIGYGVADVGEHIYTVTEVKPDLAADPNMYYDPAVYQVKVTVSYDQTTGTLSYTTPEITKDGTAATIKFSNIQNPGYVDVPIVGKKQTTGNTVPANLSFSFSVVDMEGNLATGGSAPANGAVSFTNLSYTTPGTYYYWIHETNHAGQTAHGVTYSALRYLLEVKVTRDAHNKLTAATAYYPAGTVADTNKTAADYAIEANKIDAPADNVLFTNTYAAKGAANITATKTLEDKTLVDGDFMFKLERLDANGAVLSTLYASNAANGSISFPTILVDSNDLPSGGKAIVRYVMSEVVTDANRLPGVTYSNSKYYLTITFTDDGEGKITNEVKYYTDNTFATLAQSQATPVFANSYAPKVGTTAVITAKKELSGRPLKAGEFSFNLYHVTTKNGVETETLVDTAVNAADGTVTFTRNYPAGVLNGADEITTKYVIREVNNNLGGVSYDDSNEGKGYPVTVKIVDNKNGSIGCTVTYTNGTTTSDVVFTNSYDANDTTFKPVATKDLNNRALKDNEFLFVVKEGNKTVSTGYNKADGTVVFTEIGYDAAGEHIYTISETNGGRDDIGYSHAEFYLKVTVRDNLDGTMTAAGEYFSDAACQNKINASDVVFTNTYKPSSISLQLEATKVLRGHAMKNGTFSFLVYDVTDMTKPVASGGNAAANADEVVAINFSNIGYTFDMLSGEGSSRTFIYAIAEQATTYGGVTPDSNVYYAKVVLSHNAQTGELTTAVTYHTDKSCTDANKISGVPAFVNTYDPADAEVVLHANKALINKKLEAGEFTFTLSGEGITQDKTNDATGIAAFDKLIFTAPGVYEYTISEKVSTGRNADLYTLDNAVKVIVTVEDDLRGKLIATVTYHEVLEDGSYDATVNVGAAEFINRYTAPPVTVDLTENIDATKTVKTPAGVTYSPAGFTFKVTDTTGNVIKGWKDGQEVDMVGVSDATGKITFPRFRFTTAGEYHYWISEQPSNAAGMADDLRVWEVHILVRYNEETGELYINSADVKTYLVGRTASDATTPEFINVFEPTAVTLTLEATKLLEGRELKDREFLFHLLEGNTIVAQGHNDVNGRVKFDLTYTAADIGSHAYTVKEMIPEKANNGITYDTKTYVAVTVNVSYDTENHKLVASVGNTPVANGAMVSTGVKVTNQYTVEGTTVQINANKVVTANRILKDKEFTFGLMDGENKVVATAKNDAAGWITFQLAYDKAGTYIYKMFEQPGNDKSLAYDENQYTVTVTVTDDLQGQLHAVVAYENNAVPTFVNKYRALSTTASIEAKKILQGNKTLAAGDFTFELEREDGVKVTAENLADGLVKFGVRYDEAGVYTYTLREKAGEAAGVTYDDTEYKVIVTVTDDLEGALKATVAYEGLATGETLPTFVNTYKGKAASVQITATKKLTGKTLTADAYSFTLTNKDNAKDVYTVKNDAKGNVVFNLNLTEVGTYTYVLAEATGTDVNVTYDKNTYTVTVKVTDDLQGNLKAEVTYGTTDGKAPTFENIYTPSAITVELTGEKKLKGRDMKAEEFTFEVRDAAGKTVATAKNTAKGELVFSGIALNAAGKYTFEVVEVKGSVKGMIYDDTKYIVTVEVTNEDGVLKAAVTEPKGGLVFKNTYKDPDPTNPSTGDDMPLLLLVGLMLASAGGIVLMTTRRKKRCV